LGDTIVSAEPLLNRSRRYYPAASYYNFLLSVQKGDIENAADRAAAFLASDEEPYTSLILKELVHDRRILDSLSRFGFGAEVLVDMSMAKGLYQEALTYSYLISNNVEIIAKRALCSFRLGDFEMAVPLYEEYYSRTGDAGSLLKIAYALFYQDHLTASREHLLRYKAKLSSETSASPVEQEAAYLQIQLDMAGGNVETSLQSVKDYVRRFRGTRSSDILVTMAFYNAFLNGYRSMAFQFLDRVSSHLHTAYYRAWAAYILGIYAEPSLLPEALELRPGSYYSFRTAHLIGNATDPAHEDLENVDEKLLPFRRSVFYAYYCMGYPDVVEEVLQSGFPVSQKEFRTGYHFLLSKLAYAREDPYRGIVHAEQLLENLGAPSLLSLPHEVLELLYPQVFIEIIDEDLTENGTAYDRFLVLAIIREESRYNTHARSSKGALGLMQLMPETASWILREDVTAAELANPSVNISAGTAYLEYLFNRFDSTEFVIASYNGGPNNVAKWILSDPSRSVERFVEEIPFRETRNFVKKVYTSYSMYRYLYTDGS
jgi:soluble lytic murein transglycosylase